MLSASYKSKLQISSPGRISSMTRQLLQTRLLSLERTGVLNEIQNSLVHLNSVGCSVCGNRGRQSVLLQLAAVLRDYPVIHCDLQKYGGSRRFGAELFNDIIRRLVGLVAARSGHSSEVQAQYSSGAVAAEMAPDFVRRFSSLADSATRAGYRLPVGVFSMRLNGFFLSRRRW